MVLIILLILIFSLFIPTKVWSVFVPENSPILSKGSTWDKTNVYGPSVIFDDNNIYKLWYTGYDGYKAQIGYSSSDTYLNFSPNPVSPIIPGTIIYQYDGGVEHPSVLKISNSLYKMWFHRAKSSFNSFELYYAESTNGTIWTNYTKLLFTNQTTWDQYSQTAPSVIYDENDENMKYKMWYTGSGYFNNEPRMWRIGFAYSNDGINWTKNVEPVLIADQYWEDKRELTGVANPHVLKISDKYHIWYHSNEKIGYAASSDSGMTWNKYIDPILSAKSGTYYSSSVWDPYVVYYDNKFYLFFSAFSSSSKHIGVATDTSLPEVEKPTETPTATPTVTPTATPTPSIPKNSPIIIIPGLGASWNSKDIISCDTGQSGKWSKTPFVTVYDRLIKTLQKNAKLNQNKDFYVYYYDWRLPLNDQTKKLKTFIDKVTSKSKARLIGHSLGGLLIRGYLTDYPQDDKVYKAMTIGTPHLGTILSYPLWENGEIWFDDLATKIPITQLINYCRVVKTVMNLGTVTNGLVNIDVNTYKLMSPRETIVALSPSIESLLPGFDYLKLDGQTVPFSSLKSQNIWLQNHPPDDLRTKLITDTISGSGFDTLRYLEIEPAPAKDIQAGNWLDGKPVNREKDESGDGKVLSMSSQLNSADNQVLNADHVQIVYYDEALKKILEFLNLKEISPFGIQAVPEADADTAITLMSDKDAVIEAVKPDNQKVIGQDNLLALFNPLKGNYKLKIKGSQNGQAVLQTSWFSKTGGIETDTYALKLKKNKWNNYLLLYMPESQNKLLMDPN